MAHLAVTVALLFLVCVHAVPAPKPDNPKFTLAKNSGFGLAAASGQSKAVGLAEANKGLETPVEAPLPGSTGDNVPDVTVLDNVNAGGAFATGGSQAAGILKNNKFSDDSRKDGALPFFGKK